MRIVVILAGYLFSLDSSFCSFHQQCCHRSSLPRLSSNFSINSWHHLGESWIKSRRNQQHWSSGFRRWFTESNRSWNSYRCLNSYWVRWKDQVPTCFLRWIQYRWPFFLSGWWSILGSCRSLGEYSKSSFDPSLFQALSDLSPAILPSILFRCLLLVLGKSDLRSSSRFEVYLSFRSSNSSVSDSNSPPSTRLSHISGNAKLWVVGILVFFLSCFPIRRVRSVSFRRRFADPFRQSSFLPSQVRPGLYHYLWWSSSHYFVRDSEPVSGTDCLTWRLDENKWRILKLFSPLTPSFDSLSIAT